jgi:3-hydroxyacyl-CoA dehydrogenase
MDAQSIHEVAVLGLGTMGHGIAQTFAAAGCRVRCYDESVSARDTLVDRVRANLGQMAEAGAVGDESIQQTLQRIEVLDNESEAVNPAQFVAEAVSEDLILKQDTFARVELLVAPETILASNSSSFPITETAANMQRPERAIVTHWFNPPHIVPVVEVVPGKRTSDETTHITQTFLERAGKLPVRLSKEIPGFLVNRVQVAIFREVFDLLDRGVATAEEIDTAIRGSIGLRLAAMGPLQILDFAGLDITGRVYENLVPHVRSDTELPSAVRKLVDQGHFGVKTGKGIYDYTPQSIEEKRTQRDRRFLALAKLFQDKHFLGLADSTGPGDRHA